MRRAAEPPSPGGERASAGPAAGVGAGTAAPRVPTAADTVSSSVPRRDETGRDRAGAALPRSLRSSRRHRGAPLLTRGNITPLRPSVGPDLCRHWHRRREEAAGGESEARPQILNEIISVHADGNCSNLLATQCAWLDRSVISFWLLKNERSDRSAPCRGAPCGFRTRGRSVRGSGATAPPSARNNEGCVRANSVL